jgi:DNA-directed RNA polymerase subunit RPC12/RpoP
MSIQDTPSSGGPPSRSGSRKAPSPYPACPKCQRRMTIKQVTPVLFASNIDDVVYGCEDCGTEIKRSVKRS